MQGTVIIAERSRVVRRMIEIALGGQPFELQFVGDAAAAVAACRAPGVRVLIADARLPGDGYDAIRQVKSDPGSASVRTLLLVGRNQDFDAQRARSVGADGHVTKPFLTQQLVKLVCELLGMPEPDSTLFKSSTLNIPLARGPQTGPQPAATSPLAASPTGGGLFRPAASAPPVSFPPPPASSPLAAPSAAPALLSAGRPGNPMAGTAPPAFDAEPTRQFSPPPDAAPPASPVAGIAAATVAAVTQDAGLAAALHGASRALIEEIAWEVIPQLAEAILKEEIARVVRERLASA